MVLKSADFTVQERWGRSRLFPSSHDLTTSAIWMGTLSSWRTASLFGHNVCIMECTWLCNLPVHLPLCSNSVMKIYNGTNRILRCCCWKLHTTILKQAFWSIGFFVECCTGVRSSWYRVQHEGEWYDHTRRSQLYDIQGFMVLTASYTHPLIAAEWLSSIYIILLATLGPGVYSSL
jgi:hypothetical protein